MVRAFLTRSSKPRRSTVVAWVELTANKIRQRANGRQNLFLVIKLELDANRSKSFKWRELRQGGLLHDAGDYSIGTMGAKSETRRISTQPSLFVRYAIKIYNFAIDERLSMIAVAG